MQVKTRELTGKALDWAVAKCEGYLPVYTDSNMSASPLFKPRCANIDLVSLDYSTNWAQAGPIIAREDMEFDHELTDGFGCRIECGTNEFIRARCHTADAMEPSYAKGQTHLIASMRCYVASKLGDIVDIPDDLI